MQDKYLEVSKDMFFTFVHLEKAYHWVPKDLEYWCLRKRGFRGKLVSLSSINSSENHTVVRITHGRTDEFAIRVGLHQGLRLYPFLFFFVVLDIISEEFRSGLPCELLFVDEFTLVKDTEKKIQRR